MSSSPTICASPSFVFPQGSLSSSSAANTPMVAEDLFDYFSIARNSLHSSKLVHPKGNNSISSINSDQTVVDHIRLTGLRRTDSSVSADTLIDERLAKTTPVKPGILALGSTNSVNSSTSVDRSPNGMGKNLMNLTLKVKESKNNQEFLEDCHPLDDGKGNLGLVSSAQPGNQLSGSPPIKSVSLNPENLLSRTSSTPFIFSTLNNEKPSSSNQAIQSAQASAFPFLDNFSPSTNHNHHNHNHGPFSNSTSELGPTGFLSPPILRKQLTLPSLALNTLRVNKYKPVNKELTESLPEAVHRLTGSHLETILNDSATLVIDIRPFNEYVKSHVKSAINVCLPSTLLKRPTFSVSKCISSLSDYEKNVLDTFSHSHGEGKPVGKLVLYDSYSSGLSGGNTANLAHICQKFIRDWPHIEINMLAGGFSDFLVKSSSLIELGIMPSINTSLSSHPVEDLSMSPHPHPHSAESVRPSTGLSTSEPILATRALSLGSIQMPRDIQTPVLSRFVLPKAKATFKIRHNEEVYRQESDLQLLVDFRELSSSEQEKLPQWAKKDSKQVCKEFNDLELIEKERLTNALNLNLAPSQLYFEEGLRSPPPTISCGIEYGYKNRYKDIFLYEHLRVKLDSADQINEQSDYINASYLTNNYGDEYIATQGPLSLTIGDFWKCVVNNKVPVIISLTQEQENGVTKCSPFWLPGKYKSNSNSYKISLSAEQRVQPNGFDNGSLIVIKAFDIEVDGDSSKIHRAVQIHVLTWPDMELISNPKDLLSIIQLKNRIMKGIHSKGPVLVHCSAGCGRTGVLCTVDSIVSLVKRHDVREKDDNVVFSIVNSFRKQRVSMVQTLRQYMLIYDIALTYMRYRYYLEAGNVPLSLSWDELHLEVVDQFIARCNGI